MSTAIELDYLFKRMKRLSTWDVRRCSNRVNGPREDGLEAEVEEEDDVVSTLELPDLAGTDGEVLAMDTSVSVL